MQVIRLRSGVFGLQPLFSLWIVLIPAITSVLAAEPGNAPTAVASPREEPANPDPGNTTAVRRARTRLRYWLENVMWR